MYFYTSFYFLNKEKIKKVRSTLWIFVTPSLFPPFVTTIEKYVWSRIHKISYFHHFFLTKELIQNMMAIPIDYLQVVIRKCRFPIELLCSPDKLLDPHPQDLPLLLVGMTIVIVSPTHLCEVGQGLTACHILSGFTVFRIVFSVPVVRQAGG